MPAPTDLPGAWRARAADLRRWAAAEGAAHAWEQAAAELESALRERAAEPLTLGEAAEASGYSVRRLRELVASGDIPQAGRKGAPRIRRADLPHKPGAGSGGAYDPAADAAAILKGTS